MRLNPLALWLRPILCALHNSLPGGQLVSVTSPELTPSHPTPNPSFSLPITSSHVFNRSRASVDSSGVMCPGLCHILLPCSLSMPCCLCLPASSCSGTSAISDTRPQTLTSNSSSPRSASLTNTAACRPPSLSSPILVWIITRCSVLMLDGPVQIPGQHQVSDVPRCRDSNSVQDL